MAGRQGSLLNRNGCADRVTLLTNDAVTSSFDHNDRNRRRGGRFSVMDKFTQLTGIAAGTRQGGPHGQVHPADRDPLPLINVDTDMIIPKQFLKTIKRSGLGATSLTRCASTPTATRSPISC
jgi:hypothetical protein